VAIKMVDISVAEANSGFVEGDTVVLLLALN
jgi:hypothetical protein